MKGDSAKSTLQSPLTLTKMALLETVKVFEEYLNQNLNTEDKNKRFVDSCIASIKFAIKNHYGSETLLHCIKFEFENVAIAMIKHGTNVNDLVGIGGDPLLLLYHVQAQGLSELAEAIEAKLPERPESSLSDVSTDGASKHCVIL